MEYCNYHKHDHVSSIFTPDTHIRAEEYIKRAVELGHTTYFTTNHGSGGDIFEAKSLCDKYGIRCLFGVEGYIVPNPLEKDSRNYHIVIIPRTNAARKKLNLATSRANIEGYYYKPRLFPEDLLAFDKGDLYITTACVAGLLKDEDSIGNLFMPLFKHFGDNIFLEVQSHNVDIQKDINRKCLDFHYKYGIKLIAANDSHYVYPEQAKDRLMYLKGKGVNYGEEDNFILDYPDVDTMISRFIQQGVLSEEQAKQAVENTMIFASCEDIDLDKEIKMPSVYPDMTPDEKIAELKKHINYKFSKICESENITGKKRQEYIKGIREEMKVIEDTKEINTADYFLFNEKNTDLSVNKYGGILTRTGRGSCGAFYLNRILSMTQIDRFTSPIKLYPDRFMSTARLLENRAIPDIDFNVVSQEPFQKASKELLGEYGCYPMVAYGTMKDGEAFRNVCRSHDLEFDEYNDVAKNIEEYAKDKKWQPYIEEANKFVGAIVSVSPHPCAHVLDNKDLRYEYGVIRIGDALCVMVTSSEADEYKLLKNDYLVVSVWKLIAETFDMINQPIMTVPELIKSVDEKVWDCYAQGLTCTLNQCDGEWATDLLKSYKPRNVGELSMFVACIRPSFNSWRDKFINREPYSTGSQPLDEVLKSTNSFILFQENLMQYFEWLGVSPAESIGLIKKISKKKIHQEDFDKLEDRLKAKWIENTGTDNMFSETWQMIQSCISYGFAAPHALAVAIDSLYGAYLKVNYPMEYYTVCLNNYSGDESKTKRLTEELETFGITIKPIKFRYSRDIYSCDKDNKSIYKGISSVKFMNEDVSQKLYEMRDKKFDSFIDFLKINPCNSRQTEILIRLDFFSEFGKSNKLLVTYSVFNQLFGKKQINKDKLSSYLKLMSEKYAKSEEDIIQKYANSTPKQYRFYAMDEFLKDFCELIPNEDIPMPAKLNCQKEYLGYIEYTNEKCKNFYYVTDVNTKYTPKITIYNMFDGTTTVAKISKKAYKDMPVCVGNIIKAILKKKNRVKKTENGWMDVPNEFDDWIDVYAIKM